MMSAQSRRRRAIRSALFVTVLAGTVACSSPESPSGNNGGTTIDGQTLALTIDGAVFVPTSIVVTNIAATGSTPETLSILASDGGVGGGNAQTVTMSVPSSIGVHAIGSSFATAVLRRGMFALDAIWGASNAPGQGSGTFEITSRNSTAAAGRVNVTMAAAGVGAGSTSKVLAGTFSVRY